MKSDFIQIGNVRIRRSNIASFGVAVTTIEKDRTPGQECKEILKELGASLLYSSGNVASAMVGIQLLSKIKKDRLSQIKYVYVTTYQKDNYRFYEDEVDIDKTLKDLSS